MDVLNMTFDDKNFDFVFDKACFDAIVCGENSKVNAIQMLSEIYRVLNDGGTYMCVSLGILEKRMKYFENFEWKHQIQKIQKPNLITNTSIMSGEKNVAKNYYYIYTFKKPEPVIKVDNEF